MTLTAPTRLHAPIIDLATPGVHTVLVTPALAEMWLGLNDGNRKSSAASRARLVTDMRAGSFHYTGDPLKFSADGYLVDGQNRLWAVAKTGIPTTFLVVTGVKDIVRDVIDTGSKYTLRDALERRGELAAGSLATAIAAVQSWERGDFTGDAPQWTANTIQSSIEFLHANDSIREVANIARSLSAKVLSLTSKQIAPLVWAFDKIDRDDRLDFFGKVASGAGLEAGDPILLLRGALTRQALAKQKVSNRTLMALTIKAWNAYRENVTLKQLAFRAGGSKPESFPTPI